MEYELLSHLLSPYLSGSLQVIAIDEAATFSGVGVQIDVSKQRSLVVVIRC